jgi:protein involved in polysaccharide export with SLBB domain
MSSLLTADQFPTDDVVDPSVYVLGPGDILAYQTTGIDFMEKMMVVSPENTVMLERIGVVNVAGKTLQQLRDTLSLIMKQRTATVDIFVTLRRARLVYVTLKGNVTYPGTYAVPASMRVSTFLTLMRQPWLLSKDGGLSELAKGSGMNVVPTKAQELTRSTVSTLGPFASRNIAVRHRRGAQIADLPLSRVNGNSHMDPHVREGDEIEVPYEDRTVATVSISGAVVSPTTLAYKQGDRVSLLLAAAGGPTSDADLSRAYLIHSTGGGKQPLSITPEFEVSGQDVELQPGSTIIIERRVETGASTSQGVVQV